MSQKLQKISLQRWWWELFREHQALRQPGQTTHRWVQHQAFLWLNHAEGQVVWQAEPQRAEPHHDLNTVGSALPAVNQDITPWARQGRDTQAEVKALLCPAVVALQWQSCFPADVHLATHLPYCADFCPSLSSSIWTTQLESPFLPLMFWSMKEESTYQDCKQLWVQALFYCGQDPSVSPFSYSMLEAAPAWQNLCQLNEDLPK